MTRSPGGIVIPLGFSVLALAACAGTNREHEIRELRTQLDEARADARSGNGGKAALRVAEIYNRGIPGVSIDYAESLKWYTAARALGQEVVLKKP